MNMASFKAYAHRLLRWSERYTKTDMVYLARGGFWVTTGQIITSIAAFGLSVVFANFVSPEVNGIYRYIIAIAGILSIATFSGINTAITRTVAQSGDNVALSGFKERVRYGLLGGIAGIILAVYYLINQNGMLAGAFFIAAAFLPFFDSLSIYEALLQGKKDFKTSAFSKISIHLFATLAVVASIFISGNILVIVATYFIGWGLGRGVAFYFAMKKYRPNIPVDTTTLRYGRRLSFLGAFSTAVGYLDRFIVFHFFGAVPLAVYYFATAPVLQTRTLSETLASLALPKFAKRTVKEIDAVFSKRLLQLFGLGLVVSIVYMTVAPFLFDVFFPTYQNAVLLSQIFSLSIVVALPLAFLTSALRSKPEMIKEMYILDIGGNITLLVLLGALGYAFGLVGLVLARVFASATGLFIGAMLWKIRQK